MPRKRTQPPNKPRMYSGFDCRVEIRTTPDGSQAEVRSICPHADVTSNTMNPTAEMLIALVVQHRSLTGCDCFAAIGGKATG